ncbi:hypothetical protein EVAR_80620_1 [Eumeta japonica]|uniref:Uncharacterized protein n=1 Tax=Eumeta variegata TaxID=151549 RepID=A0A4C2A1W3_EUMVA|nr:hypothetical protein EVAR_80620_1 [Eumeta japonica]
MLARRAFNRAKASPYTSLHNLAPQYDRPTKGYQRPRDLLSKSSNEEKVHFGAHIAVGLQQPYVKPLLNI